MSNQKDLKMAAFVTAALDNNCPYVVIEFSGVGDSGHVDSTTLYPEECINFDADDESYKVIHSDYSPKFKELMENKYSGAPKIPSDISNDLYEMFRSAVEEYDWWNNDGGSGTLVINLKTREYIIEHNINYTTPEDHTTTGKFEF